MDAPTQLELAILTRKVSELEKRITELENKLRTIIDLLRQ